MSPRSKNIEHVINLWTQSKEAGCFWWTPVNSHWAPPYRNMMKETFSLDRTVL